MNVQVAVLCDAATDSGGKLNVLGAFDTIHARQLPAIHPQCSIALRASFSSAEEGEHKMKLTFVNEDGKPVMPGMDIPVKIVLPEESHLVTCNFIVNIHQLKFETPGFYSIDISLDNKLQAGIPLFVRHTPPPEEGESPSF
jgi:hypothetical protein